MSEINGRGAEKFSAEELLRNRREEEEEEGSFQDCRSSRSDSFHTACDDSEFEGHQIAPVSDRGGEEMLHQKYMKQDYPNSIDYRSLTDNSVKATIKDSVGRTFYSLERKPFVRGIKIEGSKEEQIEVHDKHLKEIEQRIKDQMPDR